MFIRPSLPVSVLLWHNIDLYLLCPLISLTMWEMYQLSKFYQLSHEDITSFSPLNLSSSLNLHAGHKVTLSTLSVKLVWLFRIIRGAS